MKPRSLFVPLVVCLLSQVGCPSHVRPPDDEVTDPEVLLDAMVSRLQTLQSGRFRSVMEYYDGATRGANFRSIVLVRQPEDIHIQLLSPFGDPLRTLVSNGERLSMYDLEEQTYYSGSPTPENLARILPFFMTAGDIARVLLGGPPLDLIDADPAGLSLVWDRDRGSYRLSAPLVMGTGQLDLWVRHGDWTVEWARRTNQAGDTVFELRTGDFERFDGVAVPTRLRFLLEQPDQPIDLSIEVERVEINPDLADVLFVLDAPEGVRQVSLD